MFQNVMLIWAGKKVGSARGTRRIWKKLVISRPVAGHDLNCHKGNKPVLSFNTSPFFTHGSDLLNQSLSYGET